MFKSVQSADFLHNFKDNTYYFVCIMLNILKNNEI